MTGPRLFTVTVDGMGQQWRLDTFDEALIGPWLCQLFDGLRPPGPPFVGTDFRIVMR